MIQTFELLTFEKIAFAQSLALPGYSYELNNKGFGVYGTAPENGGLLEIGFVEENPLCLTGKDGSFTVDEQGIFIIPPESEFSVRAVNSGMHRHTSAEFLITYSVDGQTASPSRRFSFPVVLQPSIENEKIISVIRAAAQAKTTQLSQSYFEECELFMRLMRLLADRIADGNENGDASPSHRLICKRAKAYIAANIPSHITVGEIADSVGISKNYLTNVFSRTEGVSLIEYINRLRLMQTVDLIMKYGYTLSEAGEQVGFSDVNYLSRIFKKYYGMTFSEYARTHFLKGNIETTEKI